MDSRSASTTQSCILPAAEHLLRMRSSRCKGVPPAAKHPQGKGEEGEEREGGKERKRKRLNSSGKVGKKPKKARNVASSFGSKSASAQEVGGANSRGCRPQVRTCREHLPWKAALEKRGLEERFVAGKGRRSVELFHKAADGASAREVKPESKEEKWWCMNQPRSGPEFYHEDDERFGSFPQRRSKKRTEVSARPKSCSQEKPIILPELCKFHLGDECIVAADGGWYGAEVLEVEEKRVYLKIRKDYYESDRWIEYTAPPLVPVAGHRVLSCTVHMENLPSPWKGRFVIDMLREDKPGPSKTPPGSWIFDSDLPSATFKILKHHPSAERDLSVLYNAPRSGSSTSPDYNALKRKVETEIERAISAAKRRLPYLEQTDYARDLCDPTLLDENYGGESCWRCGDGGSLVVRRARANTHARTQARTHTHSFTHSLTLSLSQICSSCEAKGHIPYVEHPWCFDRPQAYMPDEDEDWLCNQCKTEKFNQDRKMASEVENDKHVRYVLEQFSSGEPENAGGDEMRKVPFEMARITDVPKEYTIGLIVGPSGSGKTLLLKGRFGYDDSPMHWKDNKAVVSEVHDCEEEAFERLLCMGISSMNDMIRPFKDLSVGQQDCARMARALGHGAVIDEFGSNLGPVGLFKLCKGLRRYVRERGLGNITVATCNASVASMLKPDWTIATGVKPGEVIFEEYPHGYWGEDGDHRVEGAFEAVSSRLLRSSYGNKKQDGNWTPEEVAKLKADFGHWEVARRLPTAASFRYQRGQDIAVRDERPGEVDARREASGEEGGASCQGGTGSEETASMDIIGMVREGWMERHSTSSEVENATVGYGTDTRLVSPPSSHSSLSSRLPSAADANGSVQCVGGVIGMDMAVSAANECGEEGRIEFEGKKTEQVGETGPYSDFDQVRREVEDDQIRVENMRLSHPNDLVEIETLVRRGMKPDQNATSLRIKLESAHRNNWSLFKEQHYLCEKETFQVNAHVYVATLPDHANQVVAMVSALPRPGRGNGVQSRTHRGHWREYRLVVLPEYQGCGIG